MLAQANSYEINPEVFRGVGSGREPTPKAHRFSTFPVLFLGRGRGWKETENLVPQKMRW